MLKIMLRWSDLVRRNLTEVAVVKAFSTTTLVLYVTLLFSNTRQLLGGVLGDHSSLWDVNATWTAK